MAAARAQDAPQTPLASVTDPEAVRASDLGIDVPVAPVKKPSVPDNWEDIFNALPIAAKRLVLSQHARQAGVGGYHKTPNGEAHGSDYYSCSCEQANQDEPMVIQLVCDRLSGHAECQLEMASIQRDQSTVAATIREHRLHLKAFDRMEMETRDRFLMKIADHQDGLKRCEAQAADLEARLASARKAAGQVSQVIYTFPLDLGEPQ